MYTKLTWQRSAHTSSVYLAAVSIGGWLGMAGVTVALESGLRSMGSLLASRSKLRSKALTLIMVDSSFLIQSANLIFSQSFERTCCMAPPGVSLLRTLLKSLQLELREGSDSKGLISPRRDISSVISPKFMLELVAEHTKLSSLYIGLGLFAITRTGYASSSNGNGSSSTTGGEGKQADRKLGDSRFVQGWLQLQLVLVRSWVLHWVGRGDEQSTPGDYIAATAVLIGLVSEFRQQFEISSGASTLGVVLDACGFNTVSIGQRRQGKVALGSYAVWEHFAMLHLDGPPLPGCCNWGCTNVSGFSEAALPTQLCSGCRRVRYCSAECQQAAWVEGEHRIVCRGL